MKTFISALSLTSLLLVALPAAAIERGDPVRGEQKAAACMACHSASAVENNKAWPRLYGQHSDYLVESLQQYKRGDRQNAIMNGQAANLSTRDMRDISAYFSAGGGELTTPKRR